MPLPLAPLVAIAAALAGSAVLARLIRKEWQRINAELHPRPDEATDRDQLPKLKRDPKTGIYRTD